MSVTDEQIIDLENKVAGNENTLQQLTPAAAWDDPTTEQEPEKRPTRYTKTATFAPSEFEYLNKIFEARQQSGLSNDWAHFLRQCVDFAVNGKHLATKNFTPTFATPDIEPVYLKNGFVNPQK